MRSSLHKDFTSDVTSAELQVLGLIGKLLTGPGMSKFYTSAADAEVSHVDAIPIIRSVINEIRKYPSAPCSIIKTEHNFFGEPLGNDSTLRKIRAVPLHPTFKEMMHQCLQSTVDLLEQQCPHYFSMDVTKKLQEETASARSHNMDAEEVMGMISALQSKSPHASMCYISCCLCATKNKTSSLIDGQSDEDRDRLLSRSISLARKKRNCRQIMMQDLRAEMILRQSQRELHHDAAAWRKIQQTLRKSGAEGVQEKFNLNTVQPSWVNSERHDYWTENMPRLGERRGCASQWDLSQVICKQKVQSVLLERF